MKALRLRTIAWLLFSLVVLNVVGAGLYGALRVLPAVREVRVATTSLQRLYGRLAEDDRWIGASHTAATRAVTAGDAAAVARLRESLANRDRLVSELPLADVPQPVRVPIARAEDLASRLVVTFDEIAALLELGRREDAVQRLGVADSLRDRFDRVLADTQARGLDNLLQRENGLQDVSRQMYLMFGAWLAVTLALASIVLVLIKKRVTGPMGALHTGLEQVQGGQLSVTLPLPASDEIGELIHHFNQMTAVLRDRAERQGRVAAVGELLAGVAHEVNNPLMAIAALAETRLAEPGLPEVERTDLESIVGQAHRAGQLLQGIIRLIRPAAGEPRAVDLNEVVRDTWDLIGFQFKADGVQGRLELVSGRLPVIAVPQKLEQAFVNLLGNAHQAVMRQQPPRKIVVRTLVEDERATALVCDNGPGVPEGVCDQLFRPFFSTLPDGRAGLGLYTSRLIARELGGEVAYRPTTEPGATFAVSLPLAPADALAPVRVERPSGQRRALEGLSILVV
ncbi:MAG: HAMP domain-containing histidine kinase, partial [Gemmatimonadetes bacterium]|nr:HAMP domain-containing histidine kinase [Gemmatimonadota bacterium]